MSETEGQNAARQKSRKPSKEKKIEAMRIGRRSKLENNIDKKQDEELREERQGNRIQEIKQSGAKYNATSAFWNRIFHIKQKWQFF